MAMLLDLEEMVRRHRKGEDPFELAIEKWVRIRDYLMKKADPERYREAFHCGSTKIIFCLDYKDHCPFCPTPAGFSADLKIIITIFSY